ncbi:hypothetical protein [Cyclobacterium plantarum]|uniref:hypothetical protein n=1 Tax=Cyclobacterium plantarum TaxID=2716263 RepID=UPI003F726FDE
MYQILSVEKEFKEEIESLWSHQDYSEIKVIERGYGIHDEIIQNSILFIGINPSFIKDSKPGSYFINLNQNAKTFDGKSYAYFKKFVDITNKLNEKQNHNCELKWSHMDLLFHRETKQHFIDNLKKEKNGIKFISHQLEISKKILLKTKPKIIIVSNTKAREFLKSKNEKISMGLEFKFDEDLGTEIIINNSELANTPVFFTSMLTGQRALDKGSYRRLVWHISYVLNKI